MKTIFEIKDKELIDQVLNDVEYGTLALCADNKPYSLPTNFVKVKDFIYFHGAKKGKKVDIILKNPFGSFSVVQDFSIIQSYFSSNDKLACPATQFFKSVMIDGKISFVEDYDEKVLALSSLMEKLQSEGGYKPLDDKVYEKMIKATLVYKLKIEDIKAKFKFAQHLNTTRFEMIISHLEQRADKKDYLTIKMMKEFKGDF